MKNFLLKFKYLLIGLFLAFAGTAYAINVTVPQSTGLGDILRGNANGTYTPYATGSEGTVLKVVSGVPTWSTDLTGGSGSVANGIAGYVTRYTGTSTITTGILLDNATVAGVNATSSTVSFTVQGSGALNPFNVASSSGNSYLFVQHNGLVGVNSSTPIGTLAVKGQAGSTAPLVIASSTGTALLTVAPNGSTTIASLGTGPIYGASGSLYTNGTTGTGVTVQATSPTLVTPILGVASGTALTLSNNLWVSGTLAVTGTSTLATTSIPALSNLTSNGFVKTSGGTGLLSVDTSTYLTGNQTITLSGDVSGSGTTGITTTIGNDKVTEAMLKVVDTPTDEDILTYESTTGDFEWHTPAQLNIPNYTYASSAYATLWNLTPGSNITITTTTVPTIAVSLTPTFTTLTVTATTTLSVATTTINGATYYWPSAVPAGNRILQSDSSGNLSWVTDQTGGGGSVSGGITGYIATWASSTGLTTGIGLDNGTVAGFNATSSTVTLNVQGSGVLSPLNIASSSGTSYLRVMPNGQVNIGTTTPTTYRLEVQDNNSANLLELYRHQGGIVLSVRTTATGVDLNTAYTNGAATWYAGILDGSLGSSNNIFGFAYNGIGNGLFMRDAGVGGGVITGINSTSPISTLAVKGVPGATSPFTVTSSTGTSLLSVAHNGSTTLSSLASAGCVAATATGSLYVTPCSSGSVTGTGTSGFGAAWTSATTLTTGKLIDNGTVIGMNATSSTIGFNIQGTAGSNTMFNVASSTGISVFRINPNGSVTIGTTTTSSLLYVQGTSTQPTVPLLSVASSTGASVFHIGSNGRVGIGTTTPNALFEAIDTSSNTQPSVLYVGGTTTPSTTKLGCLALYDDAAKLYVYMKYVSGTFTTSTSASVCQ